MSTNDNPFGWSAADFWRPWLQLAPTSLVQPISFSINSNNSTAPQTEVAVVAKHSYGRQIGRMSDALRELILDKKKPLPAAGPLFEFMEMWDEIEKVKRDGAKARIAAMASDLEQLKGSPEYKRLREALVQALKQTE